jgi:dephospho-CoA kinase
LLLRDWLRAEADERDAYGELKRQLAHSETTTTEYAEAQRLWLEKAFARADTWARDAARGDT